MNPPTLSGASDFLLWPLFGIESAVVYQFPQYNRKHLSIQRLVPWRCLNILSTSCSLKQFRSLTSSLCITIPWDKLLWSPVRRGENRQRGFKEVYKISKLGIEVGLNHRQRDFWACQMFFKVVALSDSVCGNKDSISLFKVNSKQSIKQCLLE